ncbi:UNVERIFIED_CONTAM: hypothetical protein FKN15_009546 [Acipenser sinensis]
MKCLREKGQGPRIDQYFLRSQSSQSNEIQRQEANHSSQDISTPVIDVRRTCMDTVSDEPNDPCEPGQTNQHKREKNLNGHKPGVKWPRACEKTAWNTVNTDLCFALERLSGTVEKKLDKFGDIIYAYGSERFGVDLPSPPSVLDCCIVPQWCFLQIPVGALNGALFWKLCGITTNPK